MERYGDSLQIPQVGSAATTSATGFIGEVMTLISPDFDIIMMHPLLAGMWGRSMSSFLGQKCYREFEKRESPCPHCPGCEALKTGQPQVRELEAVLDDDTLVPFLVRAYPVLGPQGAAVGFIEVHENIARRRWEEQQVRRDHSLLQAFLGTSNPSRILRLALESALGFDGVTAVCALLRGPSEEWEIVGEQGFSDSELSGLWPSREESSPSSVLEEASTVVRLPVACGGTTVAVLLARLANDALLSSNSAARLETLVQMVALGLARINADRLRGDAVANMDTLLAMLPGPMLCMDGSGAITRWNAAAADFFGWTVREGTEATLPSMQDEDLRALLARVLEKNGSLLGPETLECWCERIDGQVVRVRWTVARLHDVIGDGSRVVCFIEPVFGECPTEVGERCVPVQGLHVDGSTDRPRADKGRQARDPSCRRVLAIQDAQEDGERLREMLESAGQEVHVCHSMAEGVRFLDDARAKGETVDLAIVEVTILGVGGALDAAKMLRALDPTIAVALSSDSQVSGETAHGFTGSLRRPYEPAAVARILARIDDGAGLNADL